MKTCKIAENRLSDEEEREWLNRVKEQTECYHFDSGIAPALHGMRKQDYIEFKKQDNLFDFSAFITPMWQRHYDHIEALLLNGCNHFLQDPLVQYAIALSVGGSWQKSQLAYLEDFWGINALKTLLKEDSVFYPSITDNFYNSSETLITHLSHLTYFSKISRFDLSKLRCAIEFGGGYGSMTRLIRRLNPSCTQIILDLPIFCFLQELYIRSIFGENEVNLLCSGDAKIMEGKVNLVPIANEKVLDRIATFSPDVFFATWSLSEANAFTQKYILEKKYFEAANILAGYRNYFGETNPEQPCSHALEMDAGHEVISDKKTWFAQNQNYLFAKKTPICVSSSGLVQ